MSSKRPTINPNPDSGEILALCNSVLTIVGDLQEYLGTPAGKHDINHDDLFLTQMNLLKEVRRWSGEGIQIAGKEAGAAIDEINHATSLLNGTIEYRKKISKNISVLAAFADLALAISAGKPLSIIEKGKALEKAIEPV